MNTIQQKPKNHKPASRSVKYSEAEEEPFTRYILMNLSQCEEAVEKDVQGAPGKAIYGATEYILRELPDRKKSSVKTKFNKVLKKEVRESKEFYGSSKDMCSMKSLKTKGMYARKALVPLPKRDFVQNPMLILFKGYQKALLDKKFDSNSSPHSPESANYSLDIMLGKRNMMSEYALNLDPPTVSGKKPVCLIQKKETCDSEFSTYLSISEQLNEEHIGFNRPNEEENFGILDFGAEGSSGRPQITSKNYNNATRKNSCQRVLFGDSLLAAEADPDLISETSHFDGFDAFSIFGDYDF